MPIQYPILFKYPLAALIVVRLLSHVQLLVTSWTAAHLGPLSYAISRSLLKLVHWFRDAIQLSNPLSPPSSPALNLSQHHDLFQLIDSLLGPTFSISPSNEYSGLISFLIDWFGLLAVRGTLESLLQHHNSKAPILGHSAFFMIWLSHLYMTTGKTIALTMGANFGWITWLRCWRDRILDGSLLVPLASPFPSCYPSTNDLAFFGSLLRG